MNRYTQIMEHIFLSHYQEGITEILFKRTDIEGAARELGLQYRNRPRP